MDGMIASERHAQAPPCPRAVTFETVVLGMPLRVRSYDDETASALAGALGRGGGIADSAAAALSLDVVATASLGGVDDPEITVREGQLVLAGPGACGHANAPGRTASCEVSYDYLSSPTLLRERVLDPLILFLVTRNGRTPIHASGFILDGIAVLLAGPSGAGKSCLALAADRAGHRVLSDDTVYVQQDPLVQVWGRPAAAHLLPDDAIGLSAERQRLRSGRLKDVVLFRSGGTSDVNSQRAVLCVLARGSGPGLRRLDRYEALSRLQHVDAGFDLIADRVSRAYAALCAKGAWELTISRDPEDSIRRIEQSLPSLRQTAIP